MIKKGDKIKVKRYPKKTNWNLAMDAWIGKTLTVKYTTESMRGGIGVRCLEDNGMWMWEEFHYDIVLKKSLIGGTVL